MRRRRSNTTSCAACANGWLVAVCPWERYGDAPRATDSAVLEDTGICSRRSSSILGQMCDRISQPDGLGIERPRWIDTRTVLMDELLHPLAPAPTAGSSGREPWR